VTYCTDNGKIYVLQSTNPLKCFYPGFLSPGDYYFKENDDGTFVKKEKNDEGDVDVHYNCGEGGCEVVPSKYSLIKNFFIYKYIKIKIL